VLDVSDDDGRWTGGWMGKAVYNWLWLGAKSGTESGIIPWGDRQGRGFSEASEVPERQNRKISKEVV